MGRIRVFLINQDWRDRASTSKLLFGQSDIETVGEADNGEGAFYQFKALTPDVVLLTTALPTNADFNLVRQIRRHFSGIAIVMLVTYEDDEHLFQAIKAGAAAYLVKDAAPKELVNVIKRTFLGEYPINESLLAKPEVASRVLKLFQNFSLLGKDVEPLISPLSHRETEILEYVARGNSNKEIAQTFSISNQTVKNHVTSIMRKLAANDRTHAVVLALRHGLIRVD